MLLSQIQRLIFGDEETALCLPTSILEAERIFIPVESKYKGYQIQVGDGRVVVTRRNPWQSVAGLPSIYRFVGRLSEVQHVSGTVKIPGTVTMKAPQKIFLSIWFGLLFVFFVIGLARAILLAGKVMLSSGPVPTDDLAAIGFALGSGALVAVIGVSILAVVRLMFRGERQRLVRFCTDKAELKRSE